MLTIVHSKNRETKRIIIIIIRLILLQKKLLGFKKQNRKLLHIHMKYMLAKMLIILKIKLYHMYGIQVHPIIRILKKRLTLELLRIR